MTSTSTKYMVELGTKLDTSGVEAQLTKITSQKVNVGVKGDTKTITTMTEGYDQLGRKMKQVDTQTSVMGGSLKRMAGSFTTILGKVVKFGAATALIGGFTTSVYSAFASVKQLDDSLTQFKKVSDLNGAGLDKYTDKLTDMGTTVARTGSEMVDAATEFKKSGYSDEDSATLAKVSAMYQNVADSEMDAGTSADFIISQMLAFNIKAKDSQKIIDSVNEVSNDYAVSSTDLSLALSKTSSAMGTLGNSFDETLG